MGGVKLLQEARTAGLLVVVDGDKLVVEGPDSAEVIALQVLRNKRAIIDALAKCPHGCRAETFERIDGTRRCHGCNTVWPVRVVRQKAASAAAG